MATIQQISDPSEMTFATEETDKMIIRPLGAGQEVGRSCHLLQFKGKSILLDCGIHPGHR